MADRPQSTIAAGGGRADANVPGCRPGMADAEGGVAPATVHQSTVANKEARALAEANDAAEANAAWGGRMKAERDALRYAWLRVIQAENSCAITGRPCDARRCGCDAEQEMLIREADDDDQ